MLFLSAPGPDLRNNYFWSDVEDLGGMLFVHWTNLSHVTHDLNPHFMHAHRVGSFMDNIPGFPFIPNACIVRLSTLNKACNLQYAEDSRARNCGSATNLQSAQSRHSLLERANCLSAHSNFHHLFHKACQRNDRKSCHRRNSTLVIDEWT